MTTGVKHKEFGEHYSQLATRLAAEDVRRNTLPKAAADVKIELPKEFKLPEGMDWKFNPELPEYKWLQEAAVKNGWSQDQVTEIVGKYAEIAVGSDAQVQAAMKAEREKMGANVTARVTAIQTFLNGHIGEEYGKALLQFAGLSAKATQGLELLIAKQASQGAASFRQDGREPGGQLGRVSEAEYNAMSAAQKWDYARGFDQKQFQNGAPR